MKILLAPDSFKGSLTAFEAADAMRKGLLEANPGLEVVTHPMADGGEGTLAVLAPVIGGKTIKVHVYGMDGRTVGVSVLQFEGENGQLAWLIESARVLGLTLPDVRAIPVLKRSSKPLGTLIRAGLDAGIRCFYLALGGSASNDGGIGMLSELGLSLRGRGGEAIAPVVSAMSDLRQVGIARLDARLLKSTLHLIADVDNPLLGRRGATVVYGPQKGIAKADLMRVEGWMEHWSCQARAAFKKDVSNQPCAGAAGGLGFALLLLHAAPHPGAAFVAQLGQLDRHIRDCDRVITGEGSSDAQTLRGKAPMVVADYAARAAVPVCLMSGRIAEAGLLRRRFDETVQVAPADMSSDQAMVQAHDLLAQAARGFIQRYL